jgi:peptide subunit release factor 1 (eRF1)
VHLISRLLIKIQYLVIFSEKFIFEPKEKVKKTFYRCDSKFYIDEIINMYEDHEVNGVIYTDGSECIWYQLKGNNFKKMANINIYLQNQFKNGGQSSNRIARNREIQRDQYLLSLAEKTIDIFYNKDENKQTISNILFCGPAEFKIELSTHKLINKFFVNIQLVNMSLFNSDLIIESIKNIKDPSDIQNMTIINDMISMGDDRLVFGKEIKQMIEMCQIKTLYMHVDMKCDFKPDYKLTIIKMKCDDINKYGGIIGIKFY